jgi:hypothetical protein
MNQTLRPVRMAFAAPSLTTGLANPAEARTAPPRLSGFFTFGALSTPEYQVGCDSPAWLRGVRSSRAAVA